MVPELCGRLAENDALIYSTNNLKQNIQRGNPYVSPWLEWNIFVLIKLVSHFITFTSYKTKIVV